MTQLTWTRSTRCDSGSCVEVTYRGGVVLVRDSKLGDDSPVLSYTRRQWQQLLTAVKSAGGPRTASLRVDGVVYARPSARVLWDTGDRPLVLSWDEWVAFVAGVKDGDFDPDRLAQTGPETAPPVPQDTPNPAQAQGDQHPAVSAAVDALGSVWVTYTASDGDLATRARTPAEVAARVAPAVLRAVAARIEADYPADVWPEDSTHPEARVAAGVRLACRRMQLEADQIDEADRG